MKKLFIVLICIIIYYAFDKESGYFTRQTSDDITVRRLDNEILRFFLDNYADYLS